MKKNFFLLALTLMLGFAVQSCRETGVNPWEKPKDEDPKEDPNNLSMEKLVGTAWRLTFIEKNDKVNVIPVPQDENIMFTFLSPNTISGQAICNSFGGKIKTGGNGYINFYELFSTEAYCGDEKMDREFMLGMSNANSYNATEKELRINYTHEVPGLGICTLVFSRTNGEQNHDTELRVKQLEGHTFTLHSFVNADNEEILPGSDECTIIFMPNALGQGQGYVNFRAVCNKGYADLTFSKDYQEMNLSNISVSKEFCENQNTADRFVEFLRNTGNFEYSDYGTTLTIWSSLTTFAESKMVLKIPQDPIVTDFIEILQTPATGVPTSTYPMLYISKLMYDGTYINIDYKYGGKTEDYRISAYSNFELTLSDPPVVIIDIVADGSPNPISSLTEGRVNISTSEIRKRVLNASPQKVKMKALIRFEGKSMGELDIAI